VLEIRDANQQPQDSVELNNHAYINPLSLYSELHRNKLKRNYTPRQQPDTFLYENVTQDRLGENFLKTDRKEMCLKPYGV
jgi:hypothetical protein